jgi:hypothetical protein
MDATSNCCAATVKLARIMPMPAFFDIVLVAQKGEITFQKGYPPCVSMRTDAKTLASRILRAYRARRPAKSSKAEFVRCAAS